MSVQGFNSAKCQQRNRVAAARFGVDSTPLRFRGSTPAALNSSKLLQLKTAGTLPQTTEKALALINSRLPEGAAPLAANDVHIQFHEAANSNFVGDRFLYLSDSTLKNIAQGGEDGVSFMNSHRTGGLSTPSEMPFGQTFCGYYEEGIDDSGLAVRRATLGVYLLRGVKPNGENGPSTDDLDKGFRAGTVKDVSVGLSGGENVCNVCGYGLNEVHTNAEGDSFYACPHVPGTHYHMTDDEIEAQKQRDSRNESGVATYSLDNAHLLELSAVYDGAVPGAGIRKVMGLSRAAAQSNDLNRDSVREMLREAYEYYGALLPFDLGEIIEIKTPAANHAAHGGTMARPNRRAKLNADETEATPPADNASGDAANDDAASNETTADANEPENSDAENADENSPADENANSENANGESGDEQSGEPKSEAKPEDLATRVRVLEAQLAATKTKSETEKKDAAREKFAASLSSKIPLAARETLTELFVNLQNRRATETHLEAFVEKMPVHAALGAKNIDLREMEPPQTVDPLAREEESARAFAERQNKARRKTKS